MEHNKHGTQQVMGHNKSWNMSRYGTQQVIKYNKSWDTASDGTQQFLGKQQVMVTNKS